MHFRVCLDLCSTHCCSHHNSHFTIVVAHIYTTIMACASAICVPVGCSCSLPCFAHAYCEGEGIGRSRLGRSWLGRSSLSTANAAQRSTLRAIPTTAAPVPWHGAAPRGSFPQSCSSAEPCCACVSAGPCRVCMACSTVAASPVCRQGVAAAVISALTGISTMGPHAKSLCCPGGRAFGCA